MNRLILAMSATLFFACGDKATTGPTTNTANPCANPCGGDNPCGNPCGGNAAATDAENMDWTGWNTWTKVSKETFVSKGHQKVMVDLYVPPEHVDVYAALSGEMPEGFRVVKAQYKGADAASGVNKLTVMQKMAAGYDPDNGNWYYGVVSADGSKTMMGGKPKACVGCHSSGSDTDYVFGAPK